MFDHLVFELLHLAGLTWLSEYLGDERVGGKSLKMKHFTDTCCCCWSFNLGTGTFRGSSNFPPACPVCGPLLRSHL